MLAPTELIELAVEEGLSAIALTDHDTVDGLDEAADAASRLGILFVPGIELEIEWETGVFHLLGLGLAAWTGDLRSRLERVRKYRTERNLRMVGLMKQAGIRIDYSELLEMAGHETVGRPHFARALQVKGHVSTLQEAFDKFIGYGRPFYQQKRALTVGQACAAVHAAGGKTVIAHPGTLSLSWDELPRTLHRWKHEGVDGIEAYHPGNTLAEAHRYAAIGKEIGLIVTAGSDFHGLSGSDVRLGRSSGGQRIDVEFLKPFLEAA